MGWALLATSFPFVALQASKEVKPTLAGAVLLAPLGGYALVALRSSATSPCSGADGGDRVSPCARQQDCAVNTTRPGWSGQASA